LDSRQRFVLVFAAISMIPFTVFTFLNTSDIGIFVSAYTIEYFALRLIMNPKLRLKVDVLGLILLALFVYFVAVRVAGILGVNLP
jgi:TRAP-type mannitol/chloroaromatic compound transport system permease large subunit